VLSPKTHRMGDGMRILMWFRSDLRTADNTALSHAFEASVRRGGEPGGVIGLFLLTPGQWGAHDWGAPKVDFVLRCVRELSKELRALNVPLLIRSIDSFDQAPDAIEGLCGEFGCQGLAFNREYELNEVRRDDAVTKRLEQTGVKVRAYTDQTIVRPGTIRTNAGDHYSVYSPFKKSLLEHLTNEGVPETLQRPKKQAPIDLEGDDVPESIDGFALQPVEIRNLWPAGERDAEARLKDFIKQSLDAYKEQRDFPGVDGTSRLSAHLAAGSISPRTCIHAALKAVGWSPGDKLDPRRRDGAFTWISEVLWREFYKHLTAAHPRLSMGKPFKPETDAIEWSYDEEHLGAWKQGRTGFPIVDAAMRQLLETGWMHNRLRMIAAMFLTKDLLIDWRLGERHFMQHLVDADLANNNGGWQWSASTGTDAAPYFRIFNPESQSKKFDESGEFIRRFVPELRDIGAPDIHNPTDEQRTTTDYPKPIINHGEARERAIAAFKELSPA